MKKPKIKKIEKNLLKRFGFLVFSKNISKLFLPQKLIIPSIVLLLLFFVASIFFPKPKIEQARVIKDVVIKQVSSVIASQPVKWAAIVKASQITKDQYLLSLPKNAKNIKVKTINSEERKQLLSQPLKELTLENRKQLAKNSPALRNNILAKLSSFLLANIDSAVGQLAETANEEVIQTTEASFVDLSDQIIEQPAEEDKTKIEEQAKQEEKEQKKEEKKDEKESAQSSLSENIEADREIPEEAVATPDVAIDLPEVPTEPTEPVLETESPSDEEAIGTPDVPIVEPVEEEEFVEIDYETPAPTITEQDTETGKLVTISSPEIGRPVLPIDSQIAETVYTDVLAFTNIPEIYKVGQESKIKIKWTNNDGQEMPFTAFDLNNNGKLDYIEWTVPHLSDQIFEIIFISKAWLLDQNREIVEDIYDIVKEQDNNWATVPENNYVRVTFEQILDNTRDITIYARGGGATIEVYEKDTDNLIATFPVIDHEDTYKIYLTDLQTPTDVFDLKIVSPMSDIGALEIDYIVDPSPATLYWVGSTTSWNTATNWSTTSGVQDSSGWVPTATDSVVFDGGDVDNCTLDVALSVASINVLAAYTGILDLADSAYAHAVSGDVTLSHGAAGTVDLGTSTLTVGGNFDWSGAAGTVTAGTSTLVMTGTSKNLKAGYLASPLRSLNALTIQTGASITVPNTVGIHVLGGLFTLNGALTYNGTNYLQCSSGMTQGANGTMNGTGTLYLNGNTLTFANPSVIAPANLRVFRNVTLPSGTYSPTTLFSITSTSAGNATFTWQAGTYTFTSAFEISQSGAAVGTLTISGINNPTLIFQSDVTVTQTTGTITFSPNSTNPNQLTGTAAQTVNLAAKNMGTWVVNKPSAGAVTWTSGDTITAGGAWTSTTLTVPTGVTLAMGTNDIAVSGASNITGAVTIGASSNTGWTTTGLTIGTGGTVTCSGASKITDSGDWDSSAGTFTYSTSTVTFSATGNLTTGASANSFYNLTINSGVVTTQVTGSNTNINVYNTLTADGTISIYSGKWIYIKTSATASIGASGRITGTGTLIFENSASGKGLTTFTAGGVIDTATLYIKAPNSAAVFSSGTFDSATVSVYTTGEQVGTLTLNGNYVFTGNVDITASATRAITVANSTNNPNLTFQKNFTIVNGGGGITYTKGTGTITLSGTAAQTVNLAGKTVEGIIVNKPSAGAVTWTSGDTITAGGGWTSTTLTVPAGVTMDLADGSYAHAVTGDVTLDATAFDMGNSTLTVGGSFDYADVTTWTYGTGTLVMTGIGKTLTPKNLSSIYSLTFQTGSSVTQSGGSLYARSTLTVNGSVSIDSAKVLYSNNNCQTSIGSAGAIAGAGSFSIFNPNTGKGLTTFTSGGAITVAIFNYYSTSATAILAPGTYSSVNSYIYGYSADNSTFTPSAGTYTFTGNLTIDSFFAYILTIANTNNPNFVVQGNLTLAQTLGTLTYTKGTGTITLSGTSAQTVNLLGKDVEKFIVTKPTSGAVTWTSGDTITLGGESSTTSFTIPSGVTINAGSNNLNISTNYSNVGTFNANTGTITFNGSTTQATNPGTSHFYNLTYSGTGTIQTATNDFYIDNNLTTTGTNTWDNATNNKTITILGNIDISSNTTYTKGTGNIVLGNNLSDGTQTINFAGKTIEDIVVNGSGDTKQLTGNLVTDSISILAGTLSQKTQTINSAGSLAISNGAFFTKAEGGQALTISNTATITDSNTTKQDLGAIVIGGTSKTTTLASDIKASSLTINTGDILDSAGYTINVSGNWSNQGTFTHNNSPVILDGTDQTITGDTTFFKLTKTNTTASTLTFTAGTTQTIANTLTLQGAVGQLLSLRSSSTGNIWSIDPQSTRTVSYLDIKDSTNANAVPIACSNNCTNSNNNINWDFIQITPSNLSGSPTPDSNTSITWTWTDNSDDEDGYKLYDTNYNLVATITASNDTSYKETGLSMNSSHTRYVVSYNTAGNSSYSNSAQAVTTGGGPAFSPSPSAPAIVSPIQTIIPEIIKEIPAIIKEIPAIIKEIIIGQKIEKEPVLPPVEQVVKKEAPLAMKGELQLLSSKQLGRFVFAPLPEELSAIASKFPEFKIALSKLGINSLSDVTNLNDYNIFAPGLKEAAGLPAYSTLPFSQFSQAEKRKIPSGVLFASFGMDNIDALAKVNISSQGSIDQKITAIANKPITLTIKPEHEAESVKGYLLFKSKTIAKSKNNNLLASIGNMLASAILSVPPFKTDISQSQGQAQEELLLTEFDYKDDDKDGIFTVEILSPVAEGSYDIMTVIKYKDIALGTKVVHLLTVVDPEGYVYRKSGNEETRVNSAKVSIYWLNPETETYELWPAKNYRQNNPQTTDNTGKYSFLVPEGKYFLKVEAIGYKTYQSEILEVREGEGIHRNIELEIGSFLRQLMNWSITNTLLAIIIILLLAIVIINFLYFKSRS